MVVTLPETNTAPEKWWLGDYFPFGCRPIFRGYVSFWRCSFLGMKIAKPLPPEVLIGVKHQTSMHHFKPWRSASHGLGIGDAFWCLMIINVVPWNHPKVQAWWVLLDLMKEPARVLISVSRDSLNFFWIGPMLVWVMRQPKGLWMSGFTLVFQAGNGHPEFACSDVPSWKMLKMMIFHCLPSIPVWKVVTSWQVAPLSQCCFELG